MSIIHVKNLTKNFTYYKKEPGLAASFKALFRRKKLNVNAVDTISFDIKEGEFVGFVGPNGAGKTTTLKMLSGILYPTSGELSVIGFKPSERKREFQKKFSLVMGQKNQLWWDLPAIESFLLNKAIYEIPDKEYKKNLDHLVELLNIKDVLAIQVRKLSLGERMKCELTAALLHSPKIVFLDEPTIGLDVISQKNIRDFLTEYNKASKSTIILTSHYMEDIRRLCGRVLLIDHGKLLYDGSYANLIKGYADTKRLEIVMKNKIDTKSLAKFGQIMEIRELMISLSIPREKSAEITAHILEHYPVEDLSIHEESMEDIVSEIFKTKHVRI